jgi:transposase
MRTLRNDQWQKIRAFLEHCPDVYLGTEANSRRFIEAVLWINRTGASWRDLPPRYGNWNSIYKRFARWCDQGIWGQMLAYFADDPDMEHLILDSTVVRAHPCAAGARKTNGGQDAQALGRSRGGFSTKIHVSVDGVGNPLRLILTPGQAGDSPQAARLLAGLSPERVIGDRAYDTNDLRQQLADQGAEAVIPAHPRRTEPVAYDTHWYKERHLVECFINKIKHVRRVFSRFEKLDSRYMGFLQFTSVLIWLR